MKKLIALLMILALLISAAALPAMAEGKTETVNQVSGEAGRGGPGGQQPPQMPGGGRNGQGGPGGQQPPAMPGGSEEGQGGSDGQQPPAMPGGSQDNANGQQPPQMPGGSEEGQGGSNGQQPPAMPGDSQDNTGVQQPGNQNGSGQNNQGGPGGQKPQGKPGKNAGGKQDTPGGEPAKRLDFEQLVQEGVITRDVCDEILNYMKERAPSEGAEDTASTGKNGAQARPEGNAPSQGSEPPAIPDGNQHAAGGMEEQLLQELLDQNIITQETYDLLMARLTTAEAEGGNEEADS